jgi:plasmid stabilization system protein ParE
MEIVYKVLWTETAISHIKDIYDYHIIKAGHKIAQRSIQKIIDSTLLLETNPFLGRNEEFLKDRKQAFKFLVEGNYKIIYWLDHNFKVIHISSVFDTRQNPGKIKDIK